MTTDWRAPLLAGASILDARLAGRNPCDWPGYTPRPAVRVYRLRGGGPVAVAWDFSVHGGSFGEDDATALVAAARNAIAQRVPLLTLVRSGGIRLQEGMAALVGIPRARLALLALADAGLPHLSVADAPTTGGVWIGVASTADLRVGVEGATVAYAGPRIVQAVTGGLPAPGSHTAAGAYAAGLVDAVLPGDQVAAWVGRALRALRPEPPAGPELPGAAEPERLEPESTTGWEQVRRARSRTLGGADLLARLLGDAVSLRAPGGDDTVAARVGRLAGRPVVGVAVAARIGTRPTPDGYLLAARAYRLADRLGLPVVSLVDTPGAEPGTAAETGGIAPAMGAALDALLTCRSPTVALVHGEGGSGGALAAAAADVVLMTPDSYFAAIGPEGAGAALRLPPESCADLMRITPADLVALGAADAVVGGVDAIAAYVEQQVALPGDLRRQLRLSRWSAPLPGQL